MSCALKSRLAMLVPGLLAAALVAGCDVPNVPVGDLPGLPGGNGPTITGSLQGVETQGNVRVGLLGATRAGGDRVELTSTAVTGGNYSLQLPASPRLDMMASDTESIAFSLTAYRDLNNNLRYDPSDEIIEASAEAGTFRYFTDAGPAGSYQQGWNLFQNGRYTQNFNIAFNLRADAGV